MKTKGKTMKTQTIMITLAVKEGQEPYHPTESKLTGEYHALRHFFTDINYEVMGIQFDCTMNFTGKNLTEPPYKPTFNPSRQA